MELEFEKTRIPCLHTVLRQVQTQEQTQELRLNEGMPDIGRVLSCWGQVLLRGKEWRSGGMSITGGVMVWVLYAPEDGSAPQSLEAWLPMQLKWEFQGSEPDGDIIAMPLLYSVDARSTAARKMMVRACVGVMAEALCTGDEDIYIPSEVPQEVYILNNKYPVCIPSEVGEKAFSIEENLTVPASEPTPARILRYELRPEITDQKLLSDKLIFRGAAVVHVLYADEEGMLHSWEAEVPISQYAELKREHEDDVKASVCAAVTNLELELTEDGTFLLKAGLVGQYTIFNCTMIQLTEDAYSPVRQVTPAMTELKLPTVFDMASDVVYAEMTQESAMDRVVDIAFYPEHPKMYREDGQVTAEMCGSFHVLSHDPEGHLHCEICRWEGKKELIADNNARIEAILSPTGTTEPNISENGASVKLRMDLLTKGEAGVPMVTGLTLGDVREPDPDRPSLILCRPGDDRLWDIAKRAGSTVEMIKKANNIQCEPDNDRILLIPVL